MAPPLETVAEQDGPQSLPAGAAWPYQTCSCPSLSCIWLQDLLLLPQGEGATETYPLGSILQWFKKKQNQKMQQKIAIGCLSSSIVPWG